MGELMNPLAERWISGRRRIPADEAEFPTTEVSGDVLKDKVAVIYAAGGGVGGAGAHAFGV
jgi:hypothetical protein